MEKLFCILSSDTVDISLRRSAAEQLSVVLQGELAAKAKRGEPKINLFELETQSLVTRAERCSEQVPSPLWLIWEGYWAWCSMMMRSVWIVNNMKTSFKGVNCRIYLMYFWKQLKTFVWYTSERSPFKRNSFLLWKPQFATEFVPFYHHMF